MAITLKVLIVTLLVCPLASAQTLGELAELARRERARRASQQSEARVYTTESLAAAYQRSSPEVIPTARNTAGQVDRVGSGPTASEPAGLGGVRADLTTQMNEPFEAEQQLVEALQAGEPESDATDFAEAENEEAWITWEVEVEAQQDLIQRLEDREVRLQLDINQLGEQSESSTANPEQRNQAQQGIAEREAALARTRTDLDAARTLLKQIQLKGPGDGGP